MNKLTKSRNKIMFGVCGGISKYCGIDPTIVRLLFIFGAFASGSLLFWIYLLLAVLMPRSPDE